MCIYIRVRGDCVCLSRARMETTTLITAIDARGSPSHWLRAAVVAEAAAAAAVGLFIKAASCHCVERQTNGRYVLSCSPSSPFCSPSLAVFLRIAGDIGSANLVDLVYCGTGRRARTQRERHTTADFMYTHWVIRVTWSRETSRSRECTLFCDRYNSLFSEL